MGEGKDWETTRWSWCSVGSARAEPLCAEGPPNADLGAQRASSYMPVCLWSRIVSLFLPNSLFSLARSTFSMERRGKIHKPESSARWPGTGEWPSGLFLSVWLVHTYSPCAPGTVNRPVTLGLMRSLRFVEPLWFMIWGMRKTETNLWSPWSHRDRPW